jgi:NAD(P)H-dependent FMN reductase
MGNVHLIEPQIRVALIYGSTREGRLCDTIGRWLRAQLADYPEFVHDTIDPIELGLPNRHEREDSEAVLALEARIEHADAFIVLVPEYNHGYPAALKFLIDSVYAPWQAKPVAFVSYGGLSGGLRAVEQLRQVFAELHTVTLRDTVSFVSAWEQFGHDGRLRVPPQPAQQALRTLLVRLRWWASALKTARRTTAYREALA